MPAEDRFDHRGRLLVQPAARATDARHDLRAGPARPGAPAREPDQMVRQAGDLAQRVAHVDDRDRQAIRQPLQVGDDRPTALPIEGRQGLVHQEEAGARDQGARDRHALTLAPGEAAGAPVQEGADAEPFHRLADPDPALRPGRAAVSVLDVAAHGEVREQRGLLEHVPDAAAVRWKPVSGAGVLPGLAADPKARHGRPLDSGQAAQEGRLPGPGGAEQPRDAAAGDPQVHVQREPGPLVMVARLDEGRGARPVSGGRGARWRQARGARWRRARGGGSHGSGASKARFSA